MRLILLGITLLLCSCATGPQYFKAGSTPQEYQQQIAGCRVTTAMVPNNGDALFDAAIKMQTLQNCMMAQGWSVR